MTSATDRLADPLRSDASASSSAETIAADTTIRQLTLDGKIIDEEISEVIVDATIEQDIEGASTLSITLQDTSRELLRSGVFDPMNGAISAELDGLKFRLVQVSKNGDQLTVTFEDDEVNRLRKFKTPRAASRDKVTRAQFAELLVAEATPRIPFISPDKDVVQPIASTAKRKTSKSKAKDRDHGFAQHAKIKVKKTTASKTQRDNIERVLDVGHSRGAARKVLITAVAAMTQESECKTHPPGETAAHQGLFQMDKDKLPGKDRHNVEVAANWFFDTCIPIHKAHPSLSIAELAERVEGSGQGSLYKQWVSEATRTVSLYKGTKDSHTSNDRKYQFTRGQPGGEKNESTWDCIKRLADEVAWRAFAVAGSVYFVSEERLFASRPRMTVSEQDDGVLGLDFDFDAGKKSQECTLTIRAERWSVPPGTVIVIDDAGPASGRWLVASSTRNLFHDTTEVTLRQPLADQPEPAAEEGEKNDNAGSSSDSDAPASVKKAYARAVAIGKKRLGYAYGAGHGGFGNGPYDCSSFVSNVLHAGGLLDSIQTTGSLGGFGKAGIGKYMTVWVRPLVGARGHVYIVFNMKGSGKRKDEERFEAHGPSGARIGLQPRGSDGGDYKPRHIKGG